MGIGGRTTALITATAAAVTCAACAPQPTVDADGIPLNFRPVDNGAKLRLGQVADVKVTAKSGQSLYFHITADEPAPLTLEEVEANLGAEMQNREAYTSFRCYPITLTFLGSTGPRVDEPFRGVYQAPVDDAGVAANGAYEDDRVYCALHEQDKLPESTAAFEKGKQYRSAVFTFSQEGGRDATGVEINIEHNASPLVVYFNH